MVRKSISVYEVWTMQAWEKAGDPDRCWSVVLQESSVNSEDRAVAQRKTLKRFFFADEEYGDPNYGTASKAAKAKAEKWAATSRKRRKLAPVEEA